MPFQFSIIIAKPALGRVEGAGSQNNRDKVKWGISGNSYQIQSVKSVVMKSVIKKNPWYITGLHFECVECGRCCSGPGEGYIWITRPEIELIADFLKIIPSELRRKYLRRVSLRTTIIENPTTRDCIFLQNNAGRKLCMIYPVRPSQCRNWPFWPENLTNPSDWNKAAQKCPGINRGRLYSYDEIQKIKRNKKWWQNTKKTNGSSKE